MSKVFSKKVHISFDDVYEVLIDITENENKYESVFENEFLKALQSMTINYGAKFVLYIFDSYFEKNFDIRKVTGKFQAELTKNANWLKFGYHSIEPTAFFDDSTSTEEFKESFTRVNKEIKRFAGEDSLSRVLRLHYFRANKEMVNYLISQGVKGLLCSDDDRISYDLSEDKHRELKEQDKIIFAGMTYYNTDFRFDGKSFIHYQMHKLRDKEILVLFTHEWALGRKGLQKIETAVKWLAKNNYEFSFLE